MDKQQKFKIEIEKESWQAGYDAGLNGEPNEPAKETEALSWFSGYIEGDAERQKIGEILKYNG
jgi:ribosome modulation factor